MKEKTKALLCVGIPFLVFICLVIFFVIAGFLEVPTNKGTIYSILILVSLIGSVFTPVPNIISSIFGIKSTVKLKKQGEKTIFLIVIGVLNIVVSFAVALLWSYIIFVGGAGV